MPLGRSLKSPPVRVRATGKPIPTTPPLAKAAVASLRRLAARRCQGAKFQEPPRATCSAQSRSARSARGHADVPLVEGHGEAAGRERTRDQDFVPRPRHPPARVVPPLANGGVQSPSGSTVLVVL
jgi:hypothetical protein